MVILWSLGLHVHKDNYRIFLSVIDPCCFRPWNSSLTPKHTRHLREWVGPQPAHIPEKSTLCTLGSLAENISEISLIKTLIRAEAREKQTLSRSSVQTPQWKPDVAAGSSSCSRCGSVTSCRSHSRAAGTDQPSSCPSVSCFHIYSQNMFPGLYMLTLLSPFFSLFSSFFPSTLRLGTQRTELAKWRKRKKSEGRKNTSPCLFVSKAIGRRCRALALPQPDTRGAGAAQCSTGTGGRLSVCLSAQALGKWCKTNTPRLCSRVSPSCVAVALAAPSPAPLAGWLESREQAGRWRTGSQVASGDSRNAETRLKQQG